MFTPSASGPLPSRAPSRCAPSGPKGPRSSNTQNTFAAPDALGFARARWAAKYAAAKILQKQSDAKVSKLGVRVSKCGYTRVATFADLVRNSGTGKAGIRGVSTCASVWACPVCSARISAKRQDELNALLAASRAAGHSVLMLTQTFQHRRGDNLSAILAAFKDAQARFRRRRDWLALKSVIVGTVSALELTHSPNASWHPHGHWLIVVKGDPAAAFKAVNGLRAGWLASLDGAGLHGGKAAWHLQDASAAAGYISKWGAAEELALHGVKTARNGGRTPFVILADARDGCRQSGALFAEYAAALAGKRQLIWSNGLKSMFGIGEKSDDDAAAEIDAAEAGTLETLRSWNAEAWISARRRRVSLVHAAQTGGDLDRAEFGPTDADLWRRDQAESVLLEPPD